MNGYKPLCRVVATEASVIASESSKLKCTGLFLSTEKPSLAWARIKTSALHSGALFQIHSDLWSFHHGR